MILGIVSSNTFPTIPTLSISPSTIPIPQLATQYSQTFTVSGGYAPHTWTLTGTLPAGLSFNTSTAVLSGNTSQSGSYSFTITVTDLAGYTTSNNYEFTVGRTNSINYVVVGGGGGGGGGGSFQSFTSAGGGGGAGGYLAGSLALNTTTLDILVGVGGDGQFQLSTTNNPTNGGESAILSNSNYLVRAFGGGFGAPGAPLNNWSDGGSGASGGGSSTASTSSRGTPGTSMLGQNGYSGGRGPALGSNRSDVGAGGGGGADGIGQDGTTAAGGSGGAGILNNLAGFVCRGGQGGYTYDYPSGVAPQSYPGSGGGGGRYGTAIYTRTRGQPGAAGVVVVAYPLINLPATATGSFTYSEVNNNRVYTFTGPGTITF